jgi:Dihydrodipicolinate reductase
MKIALLGYGKMGHQVESVAHTHGHTIIATIDNDMEWIEKMKSLQNADVAIDFSQPDQAANNIYRCFDLKLPIVVGTTAWYDKLDAVKSRCNKEHQSLFYAPNFSIGMNMIFKMNEMLARFSEKYGYKLSLSETHHIHKLDKPSGTAAQLANDIIATNHHYRQWSIDESVTDDTLAIQVIRKGEVNGIHSITAVSNVDKITLTHEAFSRQGFAEGAIAAAEFLLGKTGCYTMCDLMKNI